MRASKRRVWAAAVVAALIAVPGAQAAEVVCVRPPVPLTFDAPGLIKITATDADGAHRQFEAYRQDMELYLAAVEVYSECLRGQVTLGAMTPENATREEKRVQLDQVRVLGNWSYAVKRLLR